jgi:hypothetical protein
MCFCDYGSVLHRLVSNHAPVQDTLDAWIACQAAWQYLEPIFSSPDIMAQMPEAGEKFGMVDASWRDIMDSAAADPSALAAGKSRERLDTLNEANQLLDDIQKSALSPDLSCIPFPVLPCCWRTHVNTCGVICHTVRCEPSPHVAFLRWYATAKHVPCKQAWLHI